MFTSHITQFLIPTDFWHFTVNKLGTNFAHIVDSSHDISHSKIVESYNKFSSL